MGLLKFLFGDNKSNVRSKGRRAPSIDYLTAIMLINSESKEDQLQGRNMMVDHLFHTPIAMIDPWVYLWVAKDYEEHECFKAAAEYYEKALNAGLDEAAEPLKRCSNPYNVDPNYNIRGSGYRICGTPFFSSDQGKKTTKELYQEEFEKACRALESDPTPAKREENLRTIRLLATARRCVVPSAKTFLGDLSLQENNEREAAQWYKDAADLDDPEGARKYSEALAKGRGVEKNEEESLRYLELAAKNGDAYSQYQLGLLFEKKEDEKKAKEYYQKAAQKGYLNASQKVQEMASKIREDKDGKYAKQYQEQREEIISNYRILLEKYHLNGYRIDEIFQPDDFCEKAYRFCVKRYGFEDIKRLTIELCRIAYFGSICAVMLWHKNRSSFANKSVWDVLSEELSNDFDFADIFAESFLGYKLETTISAESARLYNVIRDFDDSVEAIFFEDNAKGAISFYVMKQAYCLGMRFATTEIENGNGGIGGDSQETEFNFNIDERAHTESGHAPEKEKDESSLCAVIMDCYNAIVEHHSLPSIEKEDQLKVIAQPDDFCEKAYQYCKKQYGVDDQKKLAFELCMTSYYGCICTVALWYQDHACFESEGKTVWDSLYQLINVEFTDANAERLLKTKEGEEKAERIFGIISEYFEEVMPIFLENDFEGEACMLAMKQAYNLGIRVAKKELECGTDGESASKGEESTEDSIGKSNSEEKMKSAQEFYSECVEDYHKTANEQGLANRGIIFIPELIPIGEKTVLAFLKDPFFQGQFGGNPQMYYYVIMSLSVQAGIVFAVKWHENYSALKGGYVDQIIEEGPADACKTFLRQLGLTNNEKENDFYRAIYARWLAKHEPYWKLNDPRDYTFKATLAAYQLGISMILEKYGY